MTVRVEHSLPGTWSVEAACAHADSSIFFPESGDYRPGKAVCAGCEVRKDCLTHALENREEQGLWGGLDPTERRLLRRKMLREARKRRVA